MQQLKPQMSHGLIMSNFQLSFMEQNVIQQSAKVLSIGKVIDDPDVFEDEKDIDWRKSVWF